MLIDTLLSFTLSEVLGLVGISILMAIWLEIKNMGDDD